MAVLKRNNSGSMASLRTNDIVIESNTKIHTDTNDTSSSSSVPTSTSTSTLTLTQTSTCTDPQESIQRGGIFYTIPRVDNESREIYLDRVNHVIEILSNDDSIDIRDAIRSSYIWRNIKYYGVSYPSTLLHTISLESNVSNVTNVTNVTNVKNVESVDQYSKKTNYLKLQ